MKFFIRLIYVFFLLISIKSWGQDFKVNGVVKSSPENLPLEGVIVTNLQNRKSLVTDEGGAFSILLKDTSTFLRFSLVGYKTKTIKANKTDLVITMITEDKEVDEVVVTGYGQQRTKRELSYQAPTVTGEELAQTRRTNFLNSLAGRVPGLTVTSTSGMPGASASIMMRGGTSIGGSNQPLFVVDGVPLDNSTVDQSSIASASSSTQAGTSNLALTNRNSDYTNRIADLNPDDIESVTILKGPEATAMYGSDGAGGAIVITTKKGKAGRVRINYGNSFAMAQVYRWPQIQKEYSRGSNGIYDPITTNAYGYYYFGPKYDDSTVFYDNMKNFFKTSFSQQQDLALESGTKDLNFRISGTYINQNGVVPNTKLTRYNFRFTAFAKLNEMLNLTTTWAYISSNNDKATKGGGSFYTNLMTFPSDIDARNYINPDGTRVQYKNVLPSAELNNPFWDVNKNRSFDNTSNVTGNINLQANIINGLSATVIFGINHYSTLGTMVYHPYSSEAYSLGGYISTYENDFNGINGTARVNYVKKIGQTLNTVFAGIYMEDNKSVTNSQRGERFYEPDFVSINNTDPTSQSSILTQTKIRKERGYVGYNFNYNSLVYFSLSGTREGVSTMTSKFYDDQPFFNYGSISGGYILSDMPFMKPLKNWINFAKLRVSYATTGKGVIRPYKIDPAFGAVQTTGGGYSLGVTLSNPNLVPELSKNLEIGGAFQFFNNRFTIDVAHFNTKVSRNIIAQRISYATGGILRYANGGELTSNGWEIQAKVNPIKSKDLYWNITINFDKARTNITRLPGDLPFYYDSDTWVFGSVRSQVGVGQSLGNLSGFNFERNKNGDLLISPTTGLPTVNQTDYIPIGDRQPDFKVGIVNDFSYKGFGLSFNLDIRKGGDVFNANQEMMMINGISTRTLDRDQPRVIKGILKDGLENTNNPTPNNIAINPYYRSTYYNGIIAEADYIENVNWLRMRDITLSYTLSSKALAKQHFFKSASFYVTATDLFLITNYSGIDPNVNALTASNAAGYGGSGIDYGSIPNPRAFNVGMRFSF